MAKPGITAAQFRKELDRYSKDVVRKIATEIHGIVAMEVYKRIAERTPVLTGRARWNWNVSFNAPNIETSTSVAGVRTTGAPLTKIEREKARVVLRNIGFANLGSTVWISNGLPYIWFLEHGSSLKAPQGIVKGAIQGALEALSSSSLTAKKGPI